MAHRSPLAVCGLGRLGVRHNDTTMVDAQAVIRALGLTAELADALSAGKVRPLEPAVRERLATAAVRIGAALGPILGDSLAGEYQETFTASVRALDRQESLEPAGVASRDKPDAIERRPPQPRTVGAEDALEILARANRDLAVVLTRVRGKLGAGRGGS
jgi:hypothetical protein